MGERESGFWSKKFSRRQVLQAAVATPLVWRLGNFQPQIINGLNFPSWRRGEYQREAAQESLQGTAEVSPNFIGIKITQYQDNFNSIDIYPTENTPDDNDITSIIDLAHARGLKVMLAPQINFPEGSDPSHWHGDIGTEFNEKKWQQWFSSYRRMIYGYANLAQATGVELFVAGNEYIQASLQRPDDWARTIQVVKSIYDGPVTYAAHYENEFSSMTWASELDLLGLNPYFKLTDTGGVGKEELKIAWDNIIRDVILPTVLKWNKKLVFPEIGYLSAQGTSITPWKYTLNNDPNIPVDVNEQAICYQALYESFWKYSFSWWQGVCWWNWSTDPSLNGLDNKEYSPRGKVAAAVIAHYSGVLRQ